MADRKISDLTALTTPASGDYLPIVDISEAAAASKNKRITIEELMRGVPDGTAAAPGIAFETDPNTGIYSPGADQLAVATNGVGRLFVDASGNVGVGVTPSYTLDVAGDARISGANGLRVEGGGTGLNLYNNAGGTILDSFTASTSIQFLTQSTERLRITAAGLVGIGTSSPAYTLDVAGSTSAARIGKLNILDDSPFVTGANLAANSSFAVGTQNANSLSLFTNNNARLSITSAGLVGIGTTSPIRKFVVSNSGAEGLETGPGESANLNLQLHYNRSSSTYVTNKIDAADHLFFTSANERARIDSSGRLLVGTSSAPSAGAPTNPLATFYGSTPTLLVQNSSATTFGESAAIHIGGSSNNYYRGVKIACINDVNYQNSIAFTVNNGDAGGKKEAARIDYTGRLLVGTSTARSDFFTSAPDIQLERTTDRARLMLCSNLNAAPASELILSKTRGTTAGSATVVQQNDELGIIHFAGTDGTDFALGASITAFVDGTPGANDMPGRLVFSTTSDSASSPTERMRITSDAYVRLAAGTGGIQFNGDTAAANALDDYEEGTWTPILVSSGATFAMDNFTTGGTYAKIGRTVFLRCVLCASSITGTLTNGVFISGVPYAPTGFVHGTYVPGGVLVNAPLTGVRGDLISSAVSAGAYFDPYASVSQIRVNLLASQLQANGTGILEMTYIA